MALSNKSRIILCVLVSIFCFVWYWSEQLEQIQQAKQLAISAEEQAGLVDGLEDNIGTYGEYDESGVFSSDTPKVVVKGNVGEKAIDFVLTDLANFEAGTKVDFASLKRNKIVILLFWDPYDYFSKEQMKTLNWIYDRRVLDEKNNKEKIRFKDVEIVGFVAMSVPKNQPEINLKTLMITEGVHFTHVVSASEQESKVLMQTVAYYDLYNSLLPLTVVIDKEGIIRHKNAGFTNFDALVEQIKVLREEEKENK
ncbi:TlpA family protein disulfide reductase [Patescibacteria group bacterium]